MRRTRQLSYSARTCLNVRRLRDAANQETTESIGAPLAHNLACLGTEKCTSDGLLEEGGVVLVEARVGDRLPRRWHLVCQAIQLAFLVTHKGNFNAILEAGCDRSGRQLRCCEQWHPDVLILDDNRLVDHIYRRSSPC